MLYAATAASPYTGPVTWVCLVAGVVFLAVGLFTALRWDAPAAAAAKKAAEAAEKAAEATTTSGKVDAQAQGALKDVVTSTTELAKVLKDLTVSTRLLVIGVLLLLVAALGAGLDAIGDAAGDSQPAATSESS